VRRRSLISTQNLCAARAQISTLEVMQQKMLNVLLTATDIMLRNSLLCCRSGTPGFHLIVFNLICLFQLLESNLFSIRNETLPLTCKIRHRTQRIL